MDQGIRDFAQCEKDDAGFQQQRKPGHWLPDDKFNVSNQNVKKNSDS